MTKLEKDLAALVTMSPAQLAARWAALHAGAPPQVPPALLRRLLAQRLQEKRHGGLPLLVVRELERAAAPPAGATTPARKIELTPGTRLIRDWNGRTVAVEVREGGFCWEERMYRSLSEIARVVTGAHWSGPRFFGIQRRG
ncbi:MAG: DUF2924 domain-containing protein [Pseudomonadota bacterium]